MSRRVNKEVLRFDVSMADTESMNVSQGSEHLVSVEFDEELRDALLHLDIVSHHSVNSLRNVIHDYIEIDFVLLVSSGVKGMLHLDDVGVEQLFHDLQFSVLIPLVLIHLFDGHSLSSLGDSCLVDNTERTVTDYSLSVISQGGLVALLVLFFLYFALLCGLKIW